MTLSTSMDHFPTPYARGALANFDDSLNEHRPSSAPPSTPPIADQTQPPLLPNPPLPAQPMTTPNHSDLTSINRANGRTGLQTSSHVRSRVQTPTPFSDSAVQHRNVEFQAPITTTSSLRDNNRRDLHLANPSTRNLPSHARSRECNRVELERMFYARVTCFVTERGT